LQTSPISGTIKDLEAALEQFREIENEVKP
jgi:hypothetical protein